MEDESEEADRYFSIIRFKKGIIIFKTSSYHRRP
ncbi:hypothetical protein ANDSL2_19400 [Acetoanaerobium noterae]